MPTARPDVAIALASGPPQGAKLQGRTKALAAVGHARAGAEPTLGHTDARARARRHPASLPAGHASRSCACLAAAPAHCHPAPGHASTSCGRQRSWGRQWHSFLCLSGHLGRDGGGDRSETQRYASSVPQHQGPARARHVPSLPPCLHASMPHVEISSSTSGGCP